MGNHAMRSPNGAQSDGRPAARLQGKWGWAVAVAAVPVALSGCSSAGLPGTGTGAAGQAGSIPGSAALVPTSKGGGIQIPATGTPTSGTPTSGTPTSGTPATSGSSGGTPSGSSAGSGSNGCDLTAVISVLGESSGADAQRTASWSLLQANGWTVAVPNSDWHLNASNGGFDALSPDGGSGADDNSWPSQTPWTESALAQEFTSRVSGFNVICSSSVENSASGSSQAFEFSANSGGTPIQGVLILSILTPTAAGFYDGQTRDVYIPASQYSTSSAQDLMLIVKKAIENPQSGN